MRLVSVTILPPASHGAYDTSNSKRIGPAARILATASFFETVSLPSAEMAVAPQPRDGPHHMNRVRFRCRCGTTRLGCALPQLRGLVCRKRLTTKFGMRFDQTSIPEEISPVVSHAGP